MATNVKLSKQEVMDKLFQMMCDVHENKKDFLYKKACDDIIKLLSDENDYFLVHFYEKYCIVELCSKKYSFKKFVTYDEYLKVINLYKMFLNRKKTQCVMLGGSFNPITNAHYEMAKKIVATIPDSYVVFVPTCDYYIRSFKKYSNVDLLSEDIRYGLLTMATLKDENILVDDIELMEKREKTKTYRTLFQINEIYKPEKLSFTIGSDDLKHMAKWWSIDDLLKNFDCIVITRTIRDMEKEVENYNFVNPNNFSFLSFENRFSNLSSTMVRGYMRECNYQKVQELIPSGAYELLDILAATCDSDEETLMSIYANGLEDGEF